MLLFALFEKVSEDIQDRGIGFAIRAILASLQSTILQYSSLCWDVEVVVAREMAVIAFTYDTIKRL